jgi:hypothetical protein
MNLCSKKCHKTLIATLITGLLVGCGGGSDTQDAVVIVENIAPTITISDTSVAEMSSVTLTVSASDPDGSIASYAWNQKSGPIVVWSGFDKASVTLHTQEVTEDTDLILTVTVTDNQGAAVSQDVKVTITANIISFAIQGKVTDGPIVNAKLLISVGEQQIIATADANGDYTATISVDDSFEDDLVKIVASGAEVNSQIKLESLLGSVKKLSELAGDDGILSKQALFDVNVTNVTTAISALMKMANNGEVISSQEKLDSLVSQYDTSLVMPLATAIKLVIDYSNNFPSLVLPDNITDTLAFVAQLELVQTYLQQANQVTPDIVKLAQNAIVTDPEVIAPFQVTNALPLADTYFYMSEGNAGSGRIILKQDGTGIIYTPYNDSVGLTWSSSTDGLLLTFDGAGVVTVNYPWFPDAYGEMIQVKEETRISHRLIKWLKRSVKSEQQLFQDTSYKHYPNGEQPDTESVTSEPQIAQVVKNAGIVAASLLVETGVSYAIPIVDTEMEIVNHIDNLGAVSFRKNLNVIFNDDNTAEVLITEIAGDGTSSKLPVDAQYNISDKGHLLLTTQGDNALSLDYVFTNDKLPAVVNLLQGKIASNQAFSKLNSVNYLMLKKEISAWTPASAVGIYSLDWSFLYPNEYFWVEVYADGTALTVSIYDRDNNGIDANEISQIPGLWKINDSGSLSIRRYKKGNSFNNCTSLVYDPVITDACVLYHEREWDLHQVKNNRYYVQHTHKFFMDNRGENLGDAYQQGSHVLDWAWLDNRDWNKVAERPYAIPEIVFNAPMANKTLSGKPSSVFTLSELNRQQVMAEVELENRLLSN